MTPRNPGLLLGLVLLGCSNGSSTANDANAGGKDPASGDPARDVPNTVCPGHVDYRSGGGGLTIRTSDGAPTIASLQLSPEFCRTFTNDMPKTDARGGVAKVIIHAMFESAAPQEAMSATCVIDVTSIYGEGIQLTATITYNPHSLRQCPMNDNCCDPSLVRWLSSTSFYPADQVVTFLPASDAALDVPTTDVFLDGSSVNDAALD